MGYEGKLALQMGTEHRSSPGVDLLVCAMCIDSNVT
jgi:hypothetical protein